MKRWLCCKAIAHEKQLSLLECDVDWHEELGWLQLVLPQVDLEASSVV